MKKIILSPLIFFISVSVAQGSCFSDFDCGIGYECVKAPLKTYGTCMKVVDEYKLPLYPLPKPESIYPNMDLEGECRWDTDCPIGFKCHWKYKVCVSR